MSIFSGDSFSTYKNKQLCDFITNNSEYSQTDLNYIYAIINEMMLNTEQHAYNDSFRIKKNWYMSVEKSNDIFKIVFLDNGVGIPGSMHKKGFEPLFKTEAELLRIAFNENRSVTKEINRGRGLIFIKNSLNHKEMIKINVLSNKAKCIFYKMNSRVVEEYTENDYSLKGTLYYMEVKDDKKNRD